MSYAKAASSMLTSTIWMEDDHTRIVWFALLLMKDKNGEVQASIPGLANVARVPIQSARNAISLLLAPDPDSRTKDYEGRRIAEIDGGWLILNHKKYRDLDSDEDRREKAAERQRRFREMKSKSVTSVTGCDMSHQNSHTDTDTNPDSNADTEKGECIPLIPLLGSANQKNDGVEGLNPPNGQETLPAFAGTGATLLTFAIEPQVPPEKKTRAKRVPREFSAPSVEEVLLAAAKAGLPDDQARLFHAHYENNGWTYASGSRREPLKSWLTALTKWAAKWRCDGGRFGASNGKPAASEPPWRRRQTIEAILATHPGNPHWIGYDKDKCSQENREEYRNLKAEMASIK